MPFESPIPPLPPVPEYPSDSPSAMLARVRRLLLPRLLEGLDRVAIAGSPMGEMVLGRVPRVVDFVFLGVQARDRALALAFEIGYNRDPERPFVGVPPALRDPLPAVAFLWDGAATLREAIEGQGEPMGLWRDGGPWRWSEALGATKRLRERGEPRDE